MAFEPGLEDEMDEARHKDWDDQDKTEVREGEGN